jgi:hypothetical protein
MVSHQRKTMPKRGAGPRLERHTTANDSLSSQYVRLSNRLGQYEDEPSRIDRSMSSRRRGEIKAHTLRFGIDGSFGRHDKFR